MMIGRSNGSTQLSIFTVAVDSEQISVLIKMAVQLLQS
jgi:hypothetical protein